MAPVSWTLTLISLTSYVSHDYVTERTAPHQVNGCLVAFIRLFEEPLDLAAHTLDVQQEGIVTKETPILAKLDIVDVLVTCPP